MVEAFRLAREVDKLGSLSTVLHIYFRGILVGCADLVPGVSGATLAMLTGVYQHILSVLRAFNSETLKLLISGQWRDFGARLQLRFVAPLLLGILSGVYLAAGLVEYLSQRYPVSFWAFFCGLVAYTSAWMIRDLSFRKFGIFFLLGMVVSVWISVSEPASIMDEPDALVIFGSAALAVCATLLPGVSGSSVLLLIGQYRHFSSALHKLDWSFLCPFGLGLITGVLLFGRIVYRLWRSHPRSTLALLAGLMLGSIPRLWPWKRELDGMEWFMPAEYAVQVGAPHLFSACVSFCVAVLLVRLLAPKHPLDA